MSIWLWLLSKIAPSAVSQSEGLSEALWSVERWTDNFASFLPVQNQRKNAGYRYFVGPIRQALFLGTVDVASGSLVPLVKRFKQEKNTQREGEGEWRV